MNLQDIKSARTAQKEIIYFREKLEAVKSRDPMPIYSMYWSMAAREHFLEKHAREIRMWEDRIQERQAIVDRVLDWAAGQPADIQKIVLLRAVELMEWPEISVKVCSSTTPNTAYMRLKRALEASEAA